MLHPFKLRDHLVPFLFNEFKSEQAVLMPGLKTKVIKLNRRSSLCRIITLVHEKYEINLRPYDYKIQISIKRVRGGIRYSSSLYKSYKNIYEKLCFTESDNYFINGFFEDIFRSNFVYYVKGGKSTESGRIKDLINDFIDEYDLLELGFDYEAMRVLYYRETAKDTKLSRFQHKITNRIQNYHPVEI